MAADRRAVGVGLAGPQRQPLGRRMGHLVDDLLAVAHRQAVVGAGLDLVDLLRRLGVAVEVCAMVGAP
jgi:hypothetical protein